MHQLFAPIFQRLSAFFIESQRLRFEAAFFGKEHPTEVQRQSAAYEYAFAGWLGAVQGEAAAQAERRAAAAVIRKRLNLDGSALPSVQPPEEQSIEAIKASIRASLHYSDS